MTLQTKFKERVVLGLFQAARLWFNLLPLAAACRQGAALGRLWLRLDRRRRRIVSRNLELALEISPGSREAAIMIDDIGSHLGMNLVEFLLLQSRLGQRLLRANLTIRGLENLEAATAGGRGAIIVSAHLGNWELAGYLSREVDRPVVAVGKPLKNQPALYRLIEATRKEIGYTPLSKSGSAKSLARHLRQGAVVALLVDQRVRRRYRIWAPFFGRMVPTIPSPAALARLSDTLIVPAFTHRLRPGHHEIVIHQGFAVEEGDSRQAIAETTARINRIMEDEIRAYPEQWFWPHDRFRKQQEKTG